jgi:hypothetical protein
MELLNTLVARGTIDPNTRGKDIKTALRKLARAYETDLDHLDLATIETTFVNRLRTFFAQCSPVPSAYTQRNTIQNVKQLYRLLHESGVFRYPRHPSLKKLPRRALLAAARDSSPYLERMTAGLSRYRCTPDQWPAAIRERWDHYITQRTFDLRQTTIKEYTARMSCYLGYAINIDHPPISTWDELFDRSRLIRFITWHAKRLGAERITQTGLAVASVIATIARYEQRAEVEGLEDLRHKLPAVKPWHNKQAACHTISADELEQVALHLLDRAHQTVEPHNARYLKHPRLNRAVAHQTSLILRLMWRVPLRSRSIREMEIPKNLSKGQDGIWRLRYAGDELKISQRGGRLNRFEVPWPPELIDHLEEYLHDFRPLLPNADHEAHVFLSAKGRPLPQNTLEKRLFETVYVRLHKRLYPHLLRTLWVDRWLLNGGDVSTAAYMLNDSVQTVLARYHELRGVDHVEKAYAFNQTVLGNGKRTSPYSTA